MTKNFSINPKLRDMGTSATLASKMRVTQLKKEGKNISAFGIGESPFAVPPPIAQALRDNVHHTRYLPTVGISELREEIRGFFKRYFDYSFSSDRVMIGPGSKELLFDIMMATDCTWMIPAPGWLSYTAQAQISNSDYEILYSTIDEKYKFSEKMMRKKFNEMSEKHDKIGMIVNYPNNPTGMTLTSDEIKRIATFARNNEILIISDEIYGNVTHPDFGAKHHSLGIEYPEGTLVTNGISKDRSQMGWRFGTLILPEGQETLNKAIKTVGSETFSCVSGPIQHAMVTAYSDNKEIEKYIKDSTSIHSIMGKVTHEILNKAGFRVGIPEGGFYLLPSLNHKRDELAEKGIITSVQVTENILDKHLAACIPASAFGLPADDLSFRIAYIDYNGPQAMEEFVKNPDIALKDPLEFATRNAPDLIKGVKKLADFANTI